MADAENGVILWHDLTVEDADGVRDFYASVVGWKPNPVAMGDYDDYSMHTANTDTCVSGVCHAKGPNTDLPAQWLMYVRVADVEDAAKKVTALGGEVVAGPRPLSSGRVLVIRDPAGAVLALVDGM